MGRLITSIRNVFKYHKLKISLFFSLTALFALMIFPFNDLGDLVTEQVAKATNNAVFLQFDDLKPSLLPAPGLEFENVLVDTPVIKSLKASSLIIRPSLTQILAFKPGVAVSMDGVFKGSADISAGLEGTTPEAQAKPLVSGNIKNWDLSDVTKAFKLPFDLFGRLSLESDSFLLNMNNPQQMEGDFSLQVKEPKTGPLSVQTPIGPLPLPAFQFSEIQLSGDTKNGVVKINNLKLGKSGDELSGTAKGQFNITLQAFGPPLGAYDFSIELEILPQMEQKLGALWSILSDQISMYQRASDTSKKIYAFRVSGQSVNVPAKFSPYQ